MTKRESKLKKPEAGSSRRSGAAPKVPHILRQVIELAEPLCTSEGIELVHTEFQREARGRILRLFIDKTGGVTLDDCVNVSRQLGDLLDVELGDIGAYNLEVTSPGRERPLSKEKDFERFKGRSAKIRTTQPVNGQKNFSGVLLGLSDRTVKLSVGEKTFAFRLEDISKARLVDYDGE
jgi:ribosome maturation factor RimP